MVSGDVAQIPRNLAEEGSICLLNSFECLVVPHDDCLVAF